MVEIEGIEVTQSIQNLSNDVPLIFGKPTYVRIYLKPSSVPLELAGTSVAALVRFAVGGASGACSTNGSSADKIERSSPATLAPNGTHPSVDQQRLTWTRSLNVMVPEALWSAGASSNSGADLMVSVAGLSTESGVPISVDFSPKSETFIVHPEPQFRCRTVGFRYAQSSSGDHRLPMVEDVQTIQDFVTAAFPVASPHWSTVFIDAPDGTWPLNIDDPPNLRSESIANQQNAAFLSYLMAIRNEDMRANAPSDTVYLGAVDDPSGRLGGAAVDSPSFSAPHVVAVASIDAGGELGAHEIAHVLGCTHPGVPDRARHGADLGQRSADTTIGADYDGHISFGPIDSSPTAEDARQALALGRAEKYSSESNQAGSLYVGLDTRFCRKHPNVLHHSRWYDLMTYRHPQWVSGHTYQKLVERLVNTQLALDSYQPTATYPRLWTVIGEYDFSAGHGQIHYVLPSSYQTPVGEVNGRSERLTVEWDVLDERGTITSNASESVYLRRSEQLDLSRGAGLFQFTVACQSSELLRAVRLSIDDVVASQWGGGSDGLLNGQAVLGNRRRATRAEKERVEREECAVARLRNVISEGAHMAPRRTSSMDDATSYAQALAGSGGRFKSGRECGAVWSNVGLFSRRR